MSNDRDDDNPIGWRSIYSEDERNSRREDSHGFDPGETREESAAKPEGSSAADRGAGELPGADTATGAKGGVPAESVGPGNSESDEALPAAGERATPETRPEDASIRAPSGRTDAGDAQDAQVERQDAPTEGQDAPVEGQEAGLSRRNKHQPASGPEKEDDGRPEIRQGQNGDIFGPIALR